MAQFMNDKKLNRQDSGHLETIYSALPFSLLIKPQQKIQLKFDAVHLQDKVNNVWGEFYPDFPVPRVEVDSWRKFYLKFDNAGKVCIDGRIDAIAFENSLLEIYQAQLNNSKRLKFYEKTTGEGLIAHGKKGLTYELARSANTGQPRDALYRITRAQYVRKGLCLIEGQTNVYGPLSLAAALKFCHKNYTELTKIKAKSRG